MPPRGRCSSEWGRPSFAVASSPMLSASPEIWTKCAACAEIEAAVAAGTDFIRLEHDHIKSLSPFAMPFICKSQALFQRYTAAFAAAEIEIRPMIAGNMQRQPFYRKYVSTDYSVPNADFIH